MLLLLHLIWLFERILPLLDPADHCQHNSLSLTALYPMHKHARHNESDQLHSTRRKRHAGQHVAKVRDRVGRRIRTSHQPGLCDRALGHPVAGTTYPWNRCAAPIGRSMQAAALQLCGCIKFRAQLNRLRSHSLTHYTLTAG